MVFRLWENKENSTLQRQLHDSQSIIFTRNLVKNVQTGHAEPADSLLISLIRSVLREDLVTMKIWKFISILYVVGNSSLCLTDCA